MSDARRLISFKDALEEVERVGPLHIQEIETGKARGRVLAADVLSNVDSPPRDSSLKDGYALRFGDIARASQKSPVTLEVVGNLAAGEDKEFSITGGQAVRIMTGARIPSGADAVLPQEFTRQDGDEVVCLADSGPGRNILSKGADLSKGEVVASRGSILTPGLLGLITGAGVTRLKVYAPPKVVIVATGSELAEEGMIDESKKIFPSNRATIIAWLHRFGIYADARLCADELKALETLFGQCLEEFDVVITSGGVLDGERDLVVSVLESLGVNFLFKRVRMGPGKGVCMGSKGPKLVFNLPGGPPSNYVAFIFIALASVLRLMGDTRQFPARARATLLKDVKGRPDWTQLILARSSMKGGSLFTTPVLEESRLKRIASSDSVIIIPEGRSHIRAGDQAEIAILDLFQY
ncbi:MAG: molybdopterin molybdotransferase MoeA [Thermodesulfobacteria bacterium]|nr:molybdopterin molybdotransferase MoeA [Thermodesulfobacteriota bacterium]